MIAIALLVVAGGFILYSSMTYYSSTAPADSVFKRVMASAGLAAAAAGGALVQAIHNWTAP